MSGIYLHLAFPDAGEYESEYKVTLLWVKSPSVCSSAAFNQSCSGGQEKFNRLLTSALTVSYKMIKNDKKVKVSKHRSVLLSYSCSMEYCTQEFED